MAASTMDQTDKELLNYLQADFPIVAQPYAALGKRLGVTEAEVLERIQALRGARVIRQMSAIFDSRNLGYKSSLVAGRYPEDQVDDAATIVNRHPGVSHNYKRNHVYNMWYTLTVPPDVDIEAEIRWIHTESGAEDTIYLPTLTLFKIGVNFDMTGKEDLASTTSDDLPTRKDMEVRSLSAEELVALRALQKDLPLEPRPFAVRGAEVGISEERLLELANRFQDDGQMRRFAAVLHHRQAGFRFNGMGVWKVPEDRVDELGPIMASFRGVSHCYRRPSYPQFPYNVYTMVHGQSKEQVEGVLDAIGQRVGLSERHVLYSTREYKKIRVKYFVDDAFYANRPSLRG